MMTEYADGKGGSFKIDDKDDNCPNPHEFFLTDPVKPKECLYCGWGKKIVKEDDKSNKEIEKEEKFYCCPKNCGKCIHHLYGKIYECLDLVNNICNKEVEEEIYLEKIYEIFQEEDYYAPRVEELINKWKKENE